MSLITAPVRALSRFFGKAQSGIAALSLPSYANGTPTYTAPGFQNAVVHGLRKNEVIYACLQTKSNAVASIRLRVMDRATEQEIVEHPLRKLFERPNPFYGEFDLWRMLLLHRDLCGISYWEKLRNSMKQVVQLWPLRPDWVQPIRSSSNYIDGYKYGDSGTTEDQKRTLAVEDVMVFKNWDPMDLYGPLSPIAVAARTGDVDNALTDLTKLILEKGGIPPAVLTVQGVLDDGAITDIQRRWQMRYGGSTKWTTPAVLEHGATYQKVGMDFQEMGMESMDYRSEARICMVLDVPPILIHALVGLRRSTFNNFESTRKAWWTDSLQPMFKNIADTAGNDLLPEFGVDDSSVYLSWDYSQVAALSEESNTRYQRITNAYKGGLMSLNEARAELKLSDLGPTGDVFVHVTAGEDPGTPGGAVASGGLGSG